MPWKKESKSGGKKLTEFSGSSGKEDKRIEIKF